MNVGIVVRFAYADRRKSRLKLQRAGFHYETNSVRLIRIPGVYHQQRGTKPAQNTTNQPKQPIKIIKFDNFLKIELFIIIPNEQ